MEPILGNLSQFFLKAGATEEVCFQFCLREANQVAHELAKYAYVSKECRSWEGDPSDSVKPFVIRDSCNEQIASGLSLKKT